MKSYLRLTVPGSVLGLTLGALLLGQVAAGCSSSSSGSADGGSGGRGGNDNAGSGGSASGGAGAASGGVTGATGGVAATGGRGGAGAQGGSAGSGAGGSLHGGSSAKFICPGGVLYAPTPLPATIAITQIGPPSTPPANYFAFIEGPIWIGSLGTLFFSDNASSPAERIFKLVPPSMIPQSFMESSGSNGLAIDNDDKLIVADQRNMRITRVDPTTGQTTGVLVPPGSFKPNDVIVRSDNNLYFSDPATGFYRVSPGGAVTGPMTQVSLANGIALSTDENTLFVGAQGTRQIHRFTLGADGTVNTASDTVWATAMHDTIDGMCIDCAGDLYIGTSGGVEVYSSTGVYIGIVPTGESSNCTFGGPSRTTLYVTSRALLKVATLNIPGLPD